MPKRSITLSAEDDAFVDEMVATGRYRDAGEALKDAIGRLRDSFHEDEQKVVVLRALLDEAIDEIERGEGVFLTDEALSEFLERLTTGEAGEK